MWDCSVCSNDYRANQPMFCEEHKRYAEIAARVRKSLASISKDNKSGSEGWNALRWYNTLSDEGKYRISFLCALLVKQMERRSNKRHRLHSGFGELAALIVVVSLVDKGYL